MAVTALTRTGRRTEPVATAPRISMGAVWFVIGVVLPAVASLVARLGTIDLAYDVRLGDLMLRTGRLPRVDTFTFVAFGRPWVDQQWLAQILLALVHRSGGWDALVLLRSALIGATFIFVYLSCRAVGAGRKASALLALGSFGAAILGLALRPQLFAFALFSASVWLIASADRHPRRLWCVPPLVALWANLHGTFFLGPVLLGLAWLRERRSASSRRLIVATGLALLATLANPFGVGVWRYVVSISSDPQITNSISEWAPPTAHDAPARTAHDAGHQPLHPWRLTPGRSPLPVL